MNWLMASAHGQRSGSGRTFRPASIAWSGAGSGGDTGGMISRSLSQTYRRVRSSAKLKSLLRDNQNHARCDNQASLPAVSVVQRKLHPGIMMSGCQAGVKPDPLGPASGGFGLDTSLPAERCSTIGCMPDCRWTLRVEPTSISNCRRMIQVKWGRTARTGRRSPEPLLSVLPPGALPPLTCWDNWVRRRPRARSRRCSGSGP
jgi:hypothetical protein